jgi:hypothetical protein
MPEPLQKAAMRTSRAAPSLPPISSRAKAVFSTVSVVRMAWAACWKWSNSEPSEARPARADGDQLFRRQRNADDAGGRGKTSSARQPKIFAAAAQVARAASSPAWPAAQLALPALMAATRTRPRGAQMLLVNDERRGDDAVGGEGGGGAGRSASATMRAKSVRPLFLQAGLGGAEAEAAGDENREKSLMVGMAVNPFNLAGGWGCQPA